MVGAERREVTTKGAVAEDALRGKRWDASGDKEVAARAAWAGCA